MVRAFKMLWKLLVHYHLLGSLGIVVGVALVITAQIGDRSSFANSELYRDVTERWGAPITQVAPSVRYVESGSVFTTLKPLVLASQRVTVDAAMNYRKRGLVYFSGFDFAFRGAYQVESPESHPIDAVFVFPIEMPKNQVLLSNLVFTVNGQPASVDLAEGNKLLWTGRIAPGEKLSCEISFKGRGLNSFTYIQDPALQVRDFKLAFNVTGGINYDYQAGVAPASGVEVSDDSIALSWQYGSLESGVSVGLILPSEQSYDTIITIMVRRCWAPFILFFLGVVLLCLHNRREMRFYEAYLLASCYGLFFILVAYLAAFLNFYLACSVSFLVVALLLCFYLRATLSEMAGLHGLALTVSFLFIPNLAVILEGYTGLIYTLEIALGLAGAMVLTTRQAFRQIVDGLMALQPTTGGNHGA